MSASQFILLATVDQLGHASQSDIAAYLNQAAASVQRHLAWGLGQDYIERYDSTDGRAAVFYVTPRGQRVLDALKQDVRRELDTLIGASTATGSVIGRLQALNQRLRRAPFPDHLL